MSKPKVAFYWNASCGGCEEAVVDLAEDILKVVEAVDISFWPVALDFKRKDVEAMEDGELAVSFINGAIRTGEQEDMVNLLRKKSGLVVAFGSCAHIGGIPGLANFNSREQIFNWVYKNAPSVENPENVFPKQISKVEQGELELPEFYDTVNTLDQVIDVDYYLPGCAPPPDLIMDAVNAILEGNLPPKGSVLAPGKALCDECDRKDSKPERVSIKDIKRPHEVDIDPEKCFLEQGILCQGPATRGGCGQRCINANMPCRGCFGPTDRAKDQGAKFLSSIASIFDATEEEDIKKIVDSIVDPAGIFNFYSLPASMLKRKKMELKKNERNEEVNLEPESEQKTVSEVEETKKTAEDMGVEKEVSEKDIETETIETDIQEEKTESEKEDFEITEETKEEFETEETSQSNNVLKKLEKHLQNLHDEIKNTEKEIEEMERDIKDLDKEDENNWEDKEV